MPTVPLYDIPQVNLSPNPSVQFDAPAMPDIAGRQMQEAGKANMVAGTTAMKIADRIQDLRDDAATTAADNAFQESINKILHDPQKGYLRTSMKDAEAIRPDMDKALQEARAQASGMLQNELQREMFAKTSTKRLQMATSTMDVHQLKQLKLWDQNEAKQSVDSAQQNAVNTYGSWAQPNSQFAINKADMLAKVDRLAEKLGIPLDSEMAKDMRLDASTKLHGTVIDQMLSMPGQGKNARTYFENFVDEVSPDQRGSIQDKLKNASVKDESLTLSMEMKGSLTEQIKSLDKMFTKGEISAEVRDATVARVEHNWQMRKSQEAEGNKFAMGAAQDWILKNPGKSIMDMPQNLYQWAKNQGHLAGLDSFAQREGRPGERLTELTTRGKLLNLAMTDPDTFIKQFKDTGFSDQLALGMSGIKEMQNVASDMLRGNGKYHTTFDQKILQDAIPGAILKDKDKKDAFVAIMAEETDRWRKANPGKVPDQAAYAQVTQAANQEWISIGRWFNSTDPAYKLRGQPNAVPKDFYNNMLKAGDGVTEAEIIAAWKIKRGVK